MYCKNCSRSFAGMAVYQVRGTVEYLGKCECGRWYVFEKEGNRLNVAGWVKEENISWRGQSGVTPDKLPIETI